MHWLGPASILFCNRVRFTGRAGDLHAATIGSLESRPEPLSEANHPETATCVATCVATSANARFDCGLWSVVDMLLMVLIILHGRLFFVLSRYLCLRSVRVQLSTRTRIQTVSDSVTRLVRNGVLATAIVSRA